MAYTPIQSPLKYFGGKKKLLKTLLALIPKHTIYVEPFCGSASLFFAKPPSPIEVINDKDEAIINFFRVLREHPDELVRAVELTPYSRKEHEIAVATLDDKNLPPVERARRLVIAINQSFSGIYNGSWSYTFVPSRNCPDVWNKLPEKIRLAALRLKRAHIECGDFEEVMVRWDSEDTFFYLDPPYPIVVYQEGYRIKMEMHDHLRLLRLLKRLKGKWLLSTYENPLYDRELKGYRKLKVEVVKYSGYDKSSEEERRPEAVEVLYLNYEPPKTPIYEFSASLTSFLEGGEEFEREESKEISSPVIEPGQLTLDNFL